MYDLLPSRDAPTQRPACRNTRRAVDHDMPVYLEIACRVQVTRTALLQALGHAWTAGRMDIALDRLCGSGRIWRSLKRVGRRGPRTAIYSLPGDDE